MSRALVAVVKSTRNAACNKEHSITWQSRGQPGQRRFYAAGAAGSVTNGNFILSRFQFGAVALTSTDGMSWTVQAQINEGRFQFSGLAFGNGTFVLSTEEDFLTTPDGYTWQGYRPRISILGFENGRFLASGAQGAILSAADGVNWTGVYYGGDYSFRMVAFGNDTLVAIGAGGTTLTSPDGIQWALIRQGRVMKNLLHVTYGNGIFVSVGTGGAILTSGDGIVWSEQQSGTTADLTQVAFANGRFVAAGSQGTILTSSDATTWTSVPSGTTQYLTGLVFGYDTFVSVGSSGIILSSLDGLNRSQTSLSSGATEPFPFPDDFALNEITFGGRTFVATSYSGYIFAFADAMVWPLRAFEGTGDVTLSDLHYDRGIFLAIGRKNRSNNRENIVLSSSDGITWSVNPFDLGQAQVIEELASAGDTFILVGLDETILQSDPILNRECIPFLSVAPSAGSLPAASEKRFSLPATEPFSVNIGLWPLRVAGSPADWWVLADTPFGWYTYVYPDQWYPTLSILTARPAYQGPLSYLESFPVLTTAGLSAGRYTFYFGLDLQMNGVLDAAPLFYDHVTVEVGAAGS